MKQLNLFVINDDRFSGAVYSATAPDGIEVAIKVIDVDRPGGLGQALVQSYLSEIQHLQRLRRQNPHVVHIYDFDFDSRTGKGRKLSFDRRISSIISFIFQLIWSWN